MHVRVLKYESGWCGGGEVNICMYANEQTLSIQQNHNKDFKKVPMKYMFFKFKC